MYVIIFTFLLLTSIFHTHPLTHEVAVVLVFPNCLRRGWSFCYFFGPSNACDSNACDYFPYGSYLGPSSYNAYWDRVGYYPLLCYFPLLPGFDPWAAPLGLSALLRHSANPLGLSPYLPGSDPDSLPRSYLQC